VPAPDRGGRPRLSSLPLRERVTEDDENGGDRPAATSAQSPASLDERDISSSHSLVHRSWARRLAEPERLHRSGLVHHLAQCERGSRFNAPLNLSREDSKRNVCGEPAPFQAPGILRTVEQAGEEADG
jgi:hypothetical protein